MLVVCDQSITSVTLQFFRLLSAPLCIINTSGGALHLNVKTGTCIDSRAFNPEATATFVRIAKPGFILF
ncbi:MAG TPA: hypothetical protein VHO90_18310 [Bacteroidales bacterium]|nr:hypothetical protein [Bacteroidales bacterium]